MVRRPSSPAYFADTEGSKSEQSDMEPPHRKSKSDHGMNKTRRVHLRSPSEEDLYASGHSYDRPRRPSDPYAPKRQSSYSEGKKRAYTSKCDKAFPVTAPSPADPLGPQVCNNTASSSVPAGINHLFVHHTNTTPHGCYTNTPLYQSFQLAGQSTPTSFINGAATATAKMPEQVGYYQNAAQPNNAVHFQPQVADTSSGPMYHYYVPRSDGQHGPYMIGSGIMPQGVAGPLQAGLTTAPMLPISVINQQPYHGQPMVIGGGGPLAAGQPMMMPMASGGMGGGVPPGQPVLLNGGPASMMPGAFPLMNPMAAPVHYEPATGVGQTASEVAAACMANRELNEPQDFKPADDNPSRMYMVRQLDGAYIQMSRATIDSFGQGARWYCTDDGVFYAVRLDA